MSKKINSCFLRVSILFCLGSISSPAVAQNVLSTWTPTNTDFNNSANWSPNGALTTTNVAFFSGPASNSLSPQLTANSTIYGLNFTNSATGYTISTANNSVLTLSSAYNYVTNPIDRAPAIWAQNTSGTNRISAGLALAANTSTWNQAKGGTLEVTGNISESGGSRSLILASGVGTGTTSYYYLSGSNSYTGLTTIASGSLLTLGSANVLGTTAGATTNNGTIDLNGYSITGEAITGGGTGSDAALGFLGNNSTTAANVTGSTLTITGVSGNSIGGSGNMTIGSEIRGAAGIYLKKVGNGEITLAGNNTLAGYIAVTAGTLTLSGDNSGASGGVTLTAGTLNINNNNALGSGTLTLTAGTINNTSGMAVVNAVNNSITLGNNLTFGAIGNTASNDLNLGSGTVTAGSSRTLNLLGTGTTITMGSINNTSTAVSGATFTFNGASNTIVLGGLTIAALSPNAVNASLTGTANITINGTISNGSLFANGLTLNGSGTTTFNGNNTYSGATTINSGTLLKIGSATALGSTLTGTTVNSGGVLDMNGQAVGNEAISISTGTGGISGSGSLINSSANSASLSGAMTLLGDTTVGAGNITLRGNIGQSGGNRMLNKLGAGLLTLAGTNTYTGGTTISSGSLLVATNGSIASSSLSTVNGGSLTVNGTAGGVVVNTGGSLGGSGTVGAVTLNSGGLLNPGNSPGTFNATSASLLAGSTYNWEIQNAAGGPSAAGTNWDLLNVTNELNLSTLTTSNRLNLVLKSLDSAGLATISLLNFSSGTNYSWIFAQAGSIINANFTVGADVTDYFNIVTTAFNGGAQLASYFKVEVGSDSVSNLRTLSLTTIPEPSTGSMFGLGLAGLVVTRLLRRKQS